MHLRLSTDHPADAVSLRRWLAGDPDLPSGVTMADPRPTGGSMGATEVIDLVVSNVVALASLAVSVAGWRRARRSTTTVRVEHRGREMTVSADTPEAVQRMLRELADPEQDDPA